LPSPNVNDYQKEVKWAIQQTHGGDALWVESVLVKEVFRGETAWDGLVEVYTLSGHPKANKCFAWGVRRNDDKGWDVTAVLAIPPVTTPQTAVQAAIVAHARQATARRSPPSA
jgi:hypothetical protein